VTSVHKKINQFFPVVPVHISWEDYAGELVMYFGQESFPIVSEENWQETATAISGSPTFSSYGVPNASTFSTWQEWAYEFSTLVNGKTR